MNPNDWRVVRATLIATITAVIALAVIGGLIGAGTSLAISISASVKQADRERKAEKELSDYTTCMKKAGWNADTKASDTGDGVTTGLVSKEGYTWDDAEAKCA